jgi:hypothetical protein
MAMKVILSGGEAGGQEMDVADGETQIVVGNLMYRIDPPGKKDAPDAPRMAVFTGEKEG